MESKVVSTWVRYCLPQSSDQSPGLNPGGCTQCEVDPYGATYHIANAREDIQKGYQRKAPTEAVGQVADDPQKLKSAAGERGLSTLQTLDPIQSSCRVRRVRFHTLT